MTAPLLALVATTAVAVGTAVSLVTLERARSRSLDAPHRLTATSTAGGSRRTSRPSSALPRSVRRARRRRAFHRSLPLLFECLAAQVRAGEGPTRTLLAGAAAAGSPYAADVGRLEQRLELGMGVGEVVRWWATERSSPELASLAVVLGRGTSWGGSSAASIDGLAAAAADRREIAAEARAHASQARASAALLVASPIAFTAVMAVVDPRTTHFLVATPLGWATVAAAVGFDVVGGWWMWRLTEGVR